MESDHSKMYENGDAEFALLGQMLPLLISVAIVLWGMRQGNIFGVTPELWQPMERVLVVLSWSAIPACIISAVARITSRNLSRPHPLWSLYAFVGGILVFVLILFTI